ncbi:MAG TPA: hypothetical protein VFB23_09985 [Candidatus Acidoferrales bacterium]|jgi:hypothetical protein|nr:hypothetical protein [Candidatus Acidoferrales bacterium]
MNTTKSVKLLLLAALCAGMGLSAESAGLPGSQSGENATRQERSPLAADRATRVEEITVYKVFMAYFAAGNGSAHVADVTYPLPLDNADRCLHGIKIEKGDAARAGVHTLPQEIIPDAHRFWLFAISSASEHQEQLFRVSGLLRLSEIAFDSRHQYAVLNYDFHCGVLCGRGATVVFRKAGPTWKRLRSCGEWIS